MNLRELAMEINETNWNYTYFSSSPLKAFVSLGADAIENEMGVVETKVFYFLTVSEGDYGEIFQSAHVTLDEALEQLNTKYGHWELKEATGKSDGDGCSTCAAH